MVKKENVILQMNPSNFIACRKIKLIWRWKWGLLSLCIPKPLTQFAVQENFQICIKGFRVIVFLARNRTLILLKLSFIQFFKHTLDELGSQ
jgi:hypothetical protein